MVVTQRAKDLYAQYLEEDKEITKYAMEYLESRKKNRPKNRMQIMVESVKVNGPIYMDIYNKVCQSR
jgi:hypothetical protein